MTVRARRKLYPEYSYKGRLLEVKQKIVEMALNGSGVRDTVRVLGVGINTVIRELKKIKNKLEEVNTTYLRKKHLTFRTKIKRLVRKAICFSKLELVHDAVIGLFINLFEFGRLI